MPPAPNAKKNKKKVHAPHLRWTRTGGGYFVTTDPGTYAVVSKKDFGKLFSGGISGKSPSSRELASGGFLRERMDFSDLAGKWRTANSHLGCGPGLHILVLTLRCNQRCVYCQAGSYGAGASDMSPSTAKKCVDFAFRSPNKNITLEFQGGEPLLNWKTLKSTVLYARRKAGSEGRSLQLAMVSNFTLMTREKADFLFRNEVSVCTSLDGPAALHNANRPFFGGDSHAVTSRWLRFFRKSHDSQSGGPRIFKPSALLTVSRRSLSAPDAIVKEYARQGLEDIFIRPLSPFGAAGAAWDKIGYSAAEFGAFYRKAMDSILRLNARGTRLREKTAAMVLEKALNFRDPGYLDSRCPCGAAIGQLAYNHDGDIYTCDEGRMLGRAGNDMFKVGSVLKDSYRKAIYSDAAKACAAASNLETQPVCSRCPYRPYCGVCPVYNLETQGSLAGDMAVNQRCAMQKEIFGTIFGLLRSPSKAKLLRSWVAG